MVKAMPRVIALEEDEWRSKFGWEDELDYDGWEADDWELEDWEELRDPNETDTWRGDSSYAKVLQRATQ